MSKQNPSQLDSLIEEYLSVSNKSKKENLLIQIMSSLWRQGFQKFDDKFRSSFTKKQKVEFIENIFNILKKSETIDKGAILEILKDILIKSDVNIKDEIISVYYDELFNEKDFLLVYGIA
jgi:signal recognition particle GTPase